AKKPDSDNIAKVVLDALNGIAYHDDTQIIKLTITKAYKEEAYLSVTLMRLDT
ncbi:RusA family crossover junction endodeoxyribonuclease, partial [Hominisplanchenecus faecis]